MLPRVLTLCVTDRCNSRCRTCNIWKARGDPARELTPAEYEKIFTGYGRLFSVTIMGGEPFLRDDLACIIQVVYEKTKPEFLTIATNGTLTERIHSVAETILKTCPGLNVIINLSLDGVGRKHDEIRGLSGNFERFLRTFYGLRKIPSSQLTVGVNTVISKFNAAFFRDIYEFVRKIKPDSYIAELAENRARLYNFDLDITPDKEEYRDILRFLLKESDFTKNGGTPALIGKLRKAFYAHLLNDDSLANFEGIASGYVMSSGELCASYSRDYVLGNFRDCDYNFRKIWFGENSKEIREMLRAPEYRNLLVNVFYTNIMCRPFRLYLNPPQR